jgi:hypothetical protein
VSNRNPKDEDYAFADGGRVNLTAADVDVDAVKNLANELVAVVNSHPKDKVDTAFWAAMNLLANVMATYPKMIPYFTDVIERTDWKKMANERRADRKVTVSDIETDAL